MRSLLKTGLHKSTQEYYLFHHFVNKANQFPIKIAIVLVSYNIVDYFINQLTLIKLNRERECVNIRKRVETYLSTYLYLYINDRSGKKCVFYCEI